MNGLHIPGTPLVVDYWKRRNVPPRALYFLTHMHADHTSGLSSQWPYPIHCTPVTARLLRRKFKIRSKLIVELEVGESRLLHVACPKERVSISVTVLDANHCPGSAMFLFAGYFGRILYTGDFRYSPAMASLPELAQSSGVDILYLDNTYCHPSCQFPSREKAMETIVHQIRENGERTTLIGIHTLGKEDLLVAIAKQLGVWVGVSPERYETLRLLEADNVFTTDVGSCYVRVLPFHMVLRAVLSDGDVEDCVLGVLPTCIFSGEGAPPPPSHPCLKVVPYSDHSSYDELMEFVGVVKPRSVQPIVRSFTGDKSKITSLRCNMSSFDHLLDPTPMTTYKIPEGIAKIFSVHHRDDKPHPPTPKPILKKSSTTNSRKRRRSATGVCFLSPSKERSGCGQGEDGSHDSHVTSVREGDENGGLKTESQLVSEIVEKPIPTVKRDPVKLPKQPLEPTSGTQSSKRPILSPVVRVLAQSRLSESVSSGTFYKRTCSSKDNLSQNTGNDESQASNKRQLPSSVIRPMWFTRIEKEWGVVMSEEGGGGKVGECEGVRRGKRAREEGGSGVGKRRRCESSTSTCASDNQPGTSTCASDNQSSISTRASNNQTTTRASDNQPGTSTRASNNQPGTSTCAPPDVTFRQWLHREVDTLDFKNEVRVDLFKQAVQTAKNIAMPTYSAPLLPLSVDDIRELLVHDNHMTYKPEATSDMDNIFNKFCTSIDILSSSIDTLTF